MPSGLFGMYNLFFDRMVIQYGENNWNDNYISILRTLLVSFEGLMLIKFPFLLELNAIIYKKFLLI